ncbi:MAG: Two component system response regulator [Pseudomonadota bacterium]|jgi:DNA-binding NtrC family response regulator
MTQTLEGMKLVLVDDEPGILRALSLILSTLKCQVTALSSPQMVLEYFENGEIPDAVISDLRMPEMSGIELLFALRFKGVDVPFILMSGHATSQEVASAKGANLTAFLSKPFAPTDLIRELEKACPSMNRTANGS